MSQGTEREDLRQVPPKKFGDERPESEHADRTGGLRDNEDDARGAFDEDNDAETPTRAAGKTDDSPRQGGGGERQTGTDEKGGRSSGSGSPPGAGQRPGSSGGSSSGGPGERGSSGSSSGSGGSGQNKPGR